MLLIAQNDFATKLTKYLPFCTVFYMFSQKLISFNAVDSALKCQKEASCAEAVLTI